MFLGYVRASTDDHDLTLQLAARLGQPELARSTHDRLDTAERIGDAGAGLAEPWTGAASRHGP